MAGVATVYADSFRIAFGMTLVTIAWLVVDGGLAPLLMSGFIVIAALFLFPPVLVWERRRQARSR